MTLEPWMWSTPGAALATWGILKAIGRTTANMGASYVGRVMDSKMPEIKVFVQDAIVSAMPTVQAYVEKGTVAALNGRYPMKDTVEMRFNALEQQLVALPGAIVESKLFRAVVRHSVRNEMMRFMPALEGESGGDDTTQ